MSDFYELAQLLHHAQQTIGREVEESLKEYGLSIAKYNILNALTAAGGRLSFSALVDRLGCVRSNITGLVDRLQEDNLVQRVDHPEDRRMLYAELTDSGRDLMGKAGPAHDVALERAFDCLEDKDRATLRVLLRQLAQPEPALDGLVAQAAYHQQTDQPK